jgi:hypothetical protein
MSWLLNYITEIIQVTRAANRAGKMVSVSIKKYIFKIPLEFLVGVIKDPKCVFEVLKVTSIWRKY